MTTDQIVAAGGVVVRMQDEQLQIVLVHRPHHQDWSLPKGKQDAGEAPEATALREVSEEVGLICELGARLTPVEYFEPKRQKDKVVYYWIMCPLNADDARVDGDECDQLRWVSRDEAFSLLTYESEREVVNEAFLMLTSGGTN
jgi:8-oxo-dGTP pyrophosphatase MutT (NUDIX family)